MAFCKKPNFRHGDTVHKDGVTGVIKRIIPSKERLHVEDAHGDLFIWYDDSDVKLVKRYEKPPTPTQIKREKREQAAILEAHRKSVGEATARDRLKRSLEHMSRRLEKKDAGLEEGTCSAA